MLLLLELIPLGLHLGIVLQLRIALNINNTQFHEVTQHFTEDQRKCTLTLIFGLHCHKQEVETLGRFHKESLQQMPPTQREHPAPRLAQSLGKRIYTHAHSHKIVILVNNKRDKTQIHNRQIHLYILFYLLLAQRRVTIKLRVALVDKPEQRLSEPFGKLGTRLAVHHPKAELTGHNCSHTLSLLPFLIGHLEQILHPIDILDITHTLHVRRIIRMVVYGSHCTQAVIALDEHALAVEIGKAQRTLQLGETTLTRPVLNRREQSINHLGIINKIDPAETRSLYPPLLIGTPVQYRSNATHKLAILVGKEIICLTELKRSIAILAQCCHLIGIKVWNIIRVTLIEFISKTHKTLQLSLCLYLNNVY